MIAVLIAAAAATQPSFLKPPIGYQDYPGSALANEEQGVGQYQMVVSPAGKAESCHILVSTGHRDLDAVTCVRMMQASVAPAKDRSGAPVYGVIRKWISWSIGGPVKTPKTVDVGLTVNRLPAGADAEPVAGLTLVVDGSGKVESCDVATTSGSAALDSAACSAGVAAASVAAARDANGNAVRAVVPLGVAFSAATAGTPPK